MGIATGDQTLLSPPQEGISDLQPRHNGDCDPVKVLHADHGVSPPQTFNPAIMGIATFPGGLAGVEDRKHALRPSTPP